MAQKFTTAKFTFIDTSKKGWFTDMANQEREKVRAAKGIPDPLLPKDAKPPNGGGKPSLAFVTSEPPPDIDLPPLNDLHADWMKTMKTLVQLEPLYTWAFEERPSLMDLLSKLEHRALSTARNGLDDDYQTYKKQYLKALGDICELYFVGHHDLDKLFDVYSFATMRKITLCSRADTPPVEGEVHLYAREIPALLLAPPEHLEKIFVIKETMPGSQLI